MRPFIFRINYLILSICLFSLGLEAQTIDLQNSLGVNLTDTNVSLKTTVQNRSEVDELINFAKKFLGTPYRYSGSTPSGFDCSGFISFIFGNFGLSMVHSSYGMAELGKTVRLSEILPGDLMFFKGSDLKSNRVGHVAMVVEVSPDAIKFIHSSTSKGVTIDNFKTSKYFITRFIKAKRLDYGRDSE
jgi:cell wall-associated NlpC family hydrolase